MGKNEKSVFDDFIKAYNVFQKLEFENPLLETLKVFDILSCGALKKAGESILKNDNIDILTLGKKRKEGIPLEYIIGLANFMGHSFFCSSQTFIPKEHTGALINVALDLLKKKQGCGDNLTVIDMATGCGNIAISLSINLRKIKVLAADINPAAIEVAKKNVDKFCLQERVSLFSGDFFEPFNGLGYEEKIDMIICNPPYIPTGSLHKLSAEVVGHEPKLALDGGPFGIDFHRRLINDSIKMLKRKGILVFEMGIGQKELIARLFKNKEDYENIQYHGEGSEIRAVSAIKR
jgi:release factor glutamine methyltransferase